MIGAGLAVFVTLTMGSEALQGVLDRWAGEDTAKRVSNVWTVFPPVALTEVDYPLLGIGTGMQQNAHFALGVVTPWNSEEEPGRYLIELGILGYLLIWITRVGLIIGLLKIARRLKRAGHRGAGGAATAYALLTMLGRLTFDHVWQALYFLGTGLLLSYYVAIPPAGEPGLAGAGRRVAGR